MIFIDSGFLIALFIDKDQWHEDAVKLIDNIDEFPKKDKILSNLIIEEIITMIGSLIGAKEAVEVYNYIHDNYTVFTENKELYDRSMRTFLKYDATLSLTDSTNVEIMKELKIHEIVSFDSDFDKVNGIMRLH
ncbi:PIN domain-containing protein [Methanobrevibacter sp. TMH8]|uniref:type II toxin-antitoxin system VapC family toxin n=1 Tax=Methanobrevibacter sp. TMH8 TaxID=2848611 RepID=UPI001CCEA89D|nr:PIN domain-containing protein [Methanobrevibacter sp. TMH8]MBZ9570632.1 PIN domain-containing protein [Methanobrevibacter sp. TMH8]